jgi:uncharacterized YigZ family protein
LSEPVYIYKTIATETQGRFQSRGSKFIAYAFPMDDLSDLEARIAQLKSEHPKARHYCYGYRVLYENGIREFSSDDGEPSGSAGKPILGAIKSADLLNVGCVVVRYFGGTKLGIPGLIEAYKESTRDALGVASIRTVKRTRLYRLVMPMHLQPHMLNECKKMYLDVSNMEYSEDFRLDVDIPLLDEEATVLKLLRMLSGRDYEEVEEYLGYLGIDLISDL